MINKACETLAASGQSLKSIVKLMLQTRPASITRAGGDTSRPLIILGNGPSLNHTLEQYATELARATTMAVNFAASTDVFTQIKPRYYILADPHFFAATDTDPNLSRLYTAFAAVDWQMTLIVPVKYSAKLPPEVTGNHNISVATINAVGIEGWRWLTRAAYSSGRGMPRPRNVLVPAIACGILAGFRKIYILGADHSWIKNLEVDEQNRVISVQPHFYKESAAEQRRVDAVYADVRLHQVVESFAVALKSYHALQHWAESQGVEIFNSTPGSFIDAFPRSPLP